MQILSIIFQFLTPTLSIQYVTFIEHRWRIMGVLSVTSNVKGQIERKFSKPKNLQNFDLLGAIEIRGMKSSDFYCKSIILAWIHVVWAILRQNRLGGLTSRREPEKKSESHARLPSEWCVAVNTGLALPRSLWYETFCQTVYRYRRQIDSSDLTFGTVNVRIFLTTTLQK